MDVTSAREILEEWGYEEGFEFLDFMDEDEEQQYEEALSFLAEHDAENQEAAVFILGMYYLEKERYDLALRQFEIGATLGSGRSMEQAGRIHYFHLTKKTSRQKAFEYLYRAEEQGWDNASYLLADMYQCGVYCKKDTNLCEDIIRRMAAQSAKNDSMRPYSPEVMLRLAELWTADGEWEAARSLLVEAEDFSKRRIAASKQKRTPQEYIDTLLAIQNLIFDHDEELHVVDILDIYFADSYAADKLSFFYDGFEYTITRCDSNGTYEFRGIRFANVRDLMDKGSVGTIRLRQAYDDEKYDMRWYIMTLKRYTDISFRDINQHFCVIPMASIPQIQEMGVRMDINQNMCLFYGYIDHEAGLTLELMDVGCRTENWFDFSNQNMETGLKLRIGAIKNTGIYILKNADGEFRKRYQESIQCLSIYDVSEEIKESRENPFLDEARHPEYPDDVLVYVHNCFTGATEGCWVRIEGLVDTEEHFYNFGILLNEPYGEFPCHKGDSIDFWLQHGKDDKFICVTEV